MAKIAEEMLTASKAKMQAYYNRVAIEIQAQQAAAAAAQPQAAPVQVQAAPVQVEAPAPQPVLLPPIVPSSTQQADLLTADLYLPEELPPIDQPLQCNEAPAQQSEVAASVSSTAHAQLRAALAAPRTVNFSGGLDHWIRAISVPLHELKSNRKGLEERHKALVQWGYNLPAEGGGLCYPLCVWVKCSVAEAGQIAERLIPLAIYQLAFDESGAQKRTPTKAQLSEHRIATLGGWLLADDCSLDVGLLSPTEVSNLSLVGFKSAQQAKNWLILAQSDVLGVELRKFLPYLGLEKEKGFQTRLVTPPNYHIDQLPPLLLPKPRTAEERSKRGKKATKASLASLN